MKVKTLALVLCFVVPAGLRAETFTNVTITNNLNVGGQLNSTGRIYTPSYLQAAGVVYGSQFYGPSVLATSYIQSQGTGYFANSVAIGYPGSIAAGSFAAAIGVGASAPAYSSVVIGRNNISAGNGTTWVDTDPLFVVGNGTGTVGDANQYRNAFTVLKDGTVTMSKAQGDILMGQFGN